MTQDVPHVVTSVEFVVLSQISFDCSVYRDVLLLKIAKSDFIWVNCFHPYQHVPLNAFSGAGFSWMVGPIDKPLLF